MDAKRIEEIEARAKDALRRAFSGNGQAGALGPVVAGDVPALIAALRERDATIAKLEAERATWGEIARLLKLTWAQEKDALLSDLRAARGVAEIREMMAKRDEGSLLRRNERIAELEAEAVALRELLEEFMGPHAREWLADESAPEDYKDSAKRILKAVEVAPTP